MNQQRHGLVRILIVNMWRNDDFALALFSNIRMAPKPSRVRANEALMKTEAEIRAKLNEMLAVDATMPSLYAPGLPAEKFIFSKIACCKTLLWALGENDDDRWHIPARPGNPVRMGEPS